jgi:glycosyltransferase involved in cell wall biosynthesis
MEEPLGRSQVLPYLRGLAARGHCFDLISFEKPGVKLRFRESLEPGISWTALRYHARPSVPGTAFDMMQGLATASLLSLFARADLVHVRSYVPAATVLPLIRAANVPLLFDMRGLWADEKREDGTWSKRPRLYAATKRIERALLENASMISVLTHSMQRYFRDEYPHREKIRAPIHVIPTCTDLDRFRLDVTPDPKISELLRGHTVLTYVGSIGGRYLPEEMARFYLAFRREVGPARFLVLSRQQPEAIARILREAGAQNELVHAAVPYEQVPRYVRAAHAGIFFYRPTFGQRGCAPTKLGELLGAGVPCAGNDIGDVAEVLQSGDAGVVVRSLDADGFAVAAKKLAAIVRNPGTPATCRALAERWFSLAEAVAAYDAIYRGDSHGDSQGDSSWPSRR